MWSIVFCVWGNFIQVLEAQSWKIRLPTGMNKNHHIFPLTSEEHFCEVPYVLEASWGIKMICLFCSKEWFCNWKLPQYYERPKILWKYRSILNWKPLDLPGPLPFRHLPSKHVWILSKVTLRFWDANSALKLSIVFSRNNSWSLFKKEKTLCFQTTAIFWNARGFFHQF